MSKEKGNIAEDKACLFLYDNCFTVVERNFYSKFGEIDIIATKDNVIHFIEVKSGIDYERAVQNITPSKISKIIKTIAVYLKKNSINSAYVLDAIIVTPRSIDILENITL